LDLADQSWLSTAQPKNRPVQPKPVLRGWVLVVAVYVLVIRYHAVVEGMTVLTKAAAWNGLDS
jgi:hypothetical protein